MHPRGEHLTVEQVEEYNAKFHPESPTTAPIQFLSEPPGARIELNGDYVGDAPCIVKIPFHADNRFREQTLIRALPVSDGYTQSKTFFGYADMDSRYLKSDKIPHKVFFDMRLRPVSRDYNINLHNE